MCAPVYKYNFILFCISKNLMWLLFFVVFGFDMCVHMPQFVQGIADKTLPHNKQIQHIVDVSLWKGMQCAWALKIIFLQH